VVRIRKWSSLLIAVAVAVGAAGCERVSDRATGDAHLLVTRGFGAETLHDGPAADGGSVLDALRGVAAVTTGFGGGFVDSIDGVASDAADKRDWFYYVNGISPGRGADQQPLRTGDVAWWDYRPWGGLLDAWIVVGSWPEPFVHGYPAPPRVVNADAPLDEPLRRAGAKIGTTASRWRVRVGADAALRSRDPAWRRAMADPAGAGLTAHIDGGRVLVLGADGETEHVVSDARAIAAAVPTGATPDEGGALFAVAGLDAAAARAAAERIARDPGVLRGRFAVAFDAAGEPVGAGGRERP
jgi:hypothetical protein